MLRVADSTAIATHALGLRLLAAASFPGIAVEVELDSSRPTAGDVVP
jgi:hypothetical protein